MTKTLQELGDHLAASLPGDVLKHEIALGELMVLVKRDSIVRALEFLRDDPDCRFAQMTDICGVDFPDRGERFEVVYNLLSLTLNHRIRVKVTASEDTPVPSAAAVFSSAGWYEREVYDLFGVLFDGHPDLRRILTDYGFDGHPLRKDFPMTGFVELRYDDEEKRVRYEPVRLNQEFRHFDFLSPWEGAPLPGDEKAKGQ